MMPLQPGDKAPAFVLKDQQGNLKQSKSLRGKALVLFFYPKDNTPGCTAEACGFRDSYKQFEKLNAVVWGVSSDTELSHYEFANRLSLPFPLLSDSENTLRNAFGVPNAFGLLPGRVTYVIDRTGIIISVFSNLLNSTAHVKESLLALQKFNNKK